MEMKKTLCGLQGAFLWAVFSCFVYAKLAHQDVLQDVREVHVALRGVGAVYALAYSGANTYLVDGFVAKGGDRATWQE